MTSPPPNSPPRPGFAINPRVAVILIGLFLFVAATVVATDYFSPRSRAAETATTATAPATTGAPR